MSAIDLLGIQDFDVPMEPETLAFYKTLTPKYQHLKSTVVYHEAKKEENISKFSSDLENLISNIRSRITEIKSKVRNPSFLNYETPASIALDSINALQEEVALLSHKARSYASYQERFGSSLQTKSRFGE